MASGERSCISMGVQAHLLLHRDGFTIIVVWKRPVVPFLSLLLRQYLVPEHVLELALAAGQEPERAFHRVGGNLEASSPACCRSAVHPGWQQTGRGPWVVSEDEYCSSG